MNNISKYRRVIINGLMILGFVGVLALMQADKKRVVRDEPATQSTAHSDAANMFDVVMLKFF